MFSADLLYIRSGNYWNYDSYLNMNAKDHLSQLRAIRIFEAKATRCLGGIAFRTKNITDKEKSAQRNDFPIAVSEKKMNFRNV